MLVAFALLAASFSGEQVLCHSSGSLTGANELSAFRNSRYKVKEVVRFWIDRPSELLNLKIAFSGQPGEASVHVWKDIDHEWPFYRFEEDLVPPIAVNVSKSTLSRWREISFVRKPIPILNSGYVYIGLIWRPGRPQLAVDRKLDHPNDSRYEVFDTENPHAEEVYWPKAKGDYAVAITVRPTPKQASWFEDVTDRFGLRNAKGQAISWADVDGDGWEDLLAGGRTLFRSVKGKRFEEIDCGLNNGGRFGVFADVDGDGDQDVFVGGEEDRLFLNDGQGHFTASANKLDQGWYARCASWIDYDRDGRLDLFVAYGEDDVAMRNRLWRNMGRGRFVLADVREINGPRVPAAFTFSCSAADLDLDGRPELVALGFRLQPNQLWSFSGPSARNNAKRHAFDLARSPGCAWSGGNSTGVGIGDLNGDCLPDMWVSNLMHPDWRGHEASLPSLLFLSHGKGKYERVQAKDKGIAFDESPSDPTLGDFDNDGDLDAYISSKYHRGDFYENRGGKFVEATFQSGIRTERGESSASCDFDHDGRLDIAVQTKDQRIKLYRNVTRKRNWRQISFSSQSVGVSVRLKAGSHCLLRQVIAGKGLGSQDAMTLHYGLGSAIKIDSIEVMRLDGKWKRVKAEGVNKRLSL